MFFPLPIVGVPAAGRRRQPSLGGADPKLVVADPLPTDPAGPGLCGSAWGRGWLGWCSSMCGTSRVARSAAPQGGLLACIGIGDKGRSGAPLFRSARTRACTLLNCCRSSMGPAAGWLGRVVGEGALPPLVMYGPSPTCGSFLGGRWSSSSGADSSPVLSLVCLVLRRLAGCVSPFSARPCHRSASACGDLWDKLSKILMKIKDATGY